MSGWVEGLSCRASRALSSLGAVCQQLSSVTNIKVLYFRIAFRGIVFLKTVVDHFHVVGAFVIANKMITVYMLN